MGKGRGRDTPPGSVHLIRLAWPDDNSDEHQPRWQC
jgi:hypothetical protein